MIFPGFGVGASTDLIGKMGGGGLLGSRFIVRCLLTPHIPQCSCLYIVSRSHPFLKTIIQCAAQQALIIF